MKTLFVRYKLRLMVALLLISGLGPASAQIFNINHTANPGAIVGYNFDGTYLNSVQLLVNGDCRSIATDGTNLFVADYYYGIVGEYTTSGGVINPSLISGLTYPLAMAVSGTNLYVGDVGASGGRIGKYSTSGAVINTNFITGTSGGFGIAIIGTNLYAVNGSPFGGNGAIGEFTTDGAIVNASLISGLNSPGALRTDGTNLFLINSPSGNYPYIVSEYSPSGATISSVLISNLGVSLWMAVSGTNIYAYNNGQIGQYTTSGATINTSLITLPNNNAYWGTVAVPILPTAPPPAVGITTYSNQPVVIWPADGGNYTLQTSTNLASGNWTTVSNYVPVTGAIITNATAPGTFRLQ
jgi:hypothetical protein